MTPLSAALALGLIAAPPANLNEAVYQIRPRALTAVPLPVTLVPEQTAAGDALPLYLAAAQLLPRYSPERGRLMEVADRATEKFSRATPEELAALRKVVASMANELRLTERATEVRICDWSGLVPPPPAGLNRAIGELLPTAQAWRELAGAVKSRACLRVADKDYPGALADARTLYGLAAHIGQSGTVIQFPIASALKAIGDSVVQLAIEAGGPNLLGPLAEFPRPLIPLAPAARRELSDSSSVLPPLAAIDRKALTPGEAAARTAQLVKRFLVLIDPGPDSGVSKEDLAELAAAARLLALLPGLAAARGRLAGLGYGPKLLAAMPDSQAQLLDLTLRFRRQSDAARLALVLPAGHPLVAAVKPDATGSADGPMRMLKMLTVPLEKSRASEAVPSQNSLALLFAESLRATLAEPGAEWGPKLLDAPIVKAMPAGLAVTWDAARGAFTAPGASFRLCVWQRGG